MAKQLLLGNQAAAMGARDGGIAVISSYPGTPSTEITETAAAFPEVYTEWAANEKVAAEAALGSAVTGQACHVLYEACRAQCSGGSVVYGGLYRR